MKTLVLFVFHVMNDSVRHFIEHGIFEDPTVDFVFVSNGCDHPLNVPTYVRVLKRENKGWDFGGWSYGLLHDDNYLKYDRFMFVNSSVHGPHTTVKRWTDLFTTRITSDSKLFGCLINALSASTDSHVQSYAFCTDQVGVKLLMDKKIFSLSELATSHEDAVHNKEIRMSREIIKNGWNIGCLARYYQGIDFRHTDKYNIQFLHNISLPGAFMGSCIHPEEVIFIKSACLGHSYLRSTPALQVRKPVFVVKPKSKAARSKAARFAIRRRSGKR